MAFQVTQVQKALKGADYPMDGKALSALAKENGADDDLVEALKGLREVDGPNGVMKELKGELGGSTPGGNSKDEKQYKDVEGPAFQVNEVQKYLKGASYPMDGKALAQLAKKNGAGADLVGALEGLREVEGPNGVMKELKTPRGGKPGAACPRPPPDSPGEDGGAALGPGQRVAHAVFDALLRPPAQQPLRLVRLGVAAGDVAGPRRARADPEPAADRRLERRDELEHRRPGARAEVDHLVGLVGRGRVEALQRGDVGLREFPDVDEVADPRAVAGRPVRAGDGERLAAPVGRDQLAER